MLIILVLSLVRTGLRFRGKVYCESVRGFMLFGRDGGFSFRFLFRVDVRFCVFFRGK